jgi:hypothetical protein
MHLQRLAPLLATFKDCLRSALGISALALVIAGLNAAPVCGDDHNDTKNVNVVNTPAHPVPVVVEGTTTISGTVSIGNQPSVSLAPGANVTVSGRRTVPVFVRDLDNPARQPFEADVSVTVPDTFGGQNAVITIVPVGKMLVVEHVSVISFLPLGQKFSGSVNINFARYHHLVSTARGAFGSADLFEISQPIRLYVGPGATLNARADRDIAMGAGQARFTISGYMVDCGAGPGCSLP